MDIETQITTFITCVIPIFVTSIILYIIRVVKGPTIPDRNLAVDAMSYTVGVILVLLTFHFRSAAGILIPCAILFMLWCYALDVYISKYLMSREEMGE